MLTLIVLQSTTRYVYNQALLRHKALAIHARAWNDLLAVTNNY